MDITKIMGVGIVGAMAALVVKQYRPENAMVIGIASAGLVLVLVLPQVEYVIGVIWSTAARLNLNIEYIVTVLRMIAVAYLAQFGAELCRDAGQGAIAAKIELAGKIIIVAMSVPVLLALMNLLIGMLP